MITSYIKTLYLLSTQGPQGEVGPKGDTVGSYLPPLHKRQVFR